jgi:hypothetical protein
MDANVKTRFEALTAARERVAALDARIAALDARIAASTSTSAARARARTLAVLDERAPPPPEDEPEDIDALRSARAVLQSDAAEAREALDIAAGEYRGACVQAVERLRDEAQARVVAAVEALALGVSEVWAFDDLLATTSPRALLPGSVAGGVRVPQFVSNQPPLDHFRLRDALAPLARPGARARALDVLGNPPSLPWEK